MTSIASEVRGVVEPVDTFRAAFVADWVDATFMHFEIDPAALRPHVPFKLDLFEGKAYVSLVAFTQRGLRLSRGGWLTRWMTAPVATHAFLNLRTYVRHEGRAAIYFLAEWIPNRLALLTGPRMYGLPFKLGRLAYEDGLLKVEADGRFEGTVRADGELGESEVGSLDEFLIERYSAFTCRKGVGRRFDIRHAPWKQCEADVAIVEDAMIRRAMPWFGAARFVGANYSPGVRDVEIGKAQRVEVQALTPTLSHEYKGEGVITWTPLVMLTIGALVAGPFVRHWMFMWALAYGLFFGCKWATFWPARRLSPGLFRSMGYLLGWPGMDARAFFTSKGSTPALGRWLWAGAKVVIGAVLLYVAARHVAPAALGAWVAMLGLILMLHFGVFDLLAFAWQSMGVDADPLMRAPIKSRTLGEFWGLRWNRGFRCLAHDWVFRPLVSRIGPAGATMAAFLFSGIIHDAVISLPARAWIGVPTLYFMLQGAGVLFEKSRTGRALLRGWRARAFTILITAGPAIVLFHPPFIDRVVIPFLKTIGALS